MQMKPGSWRGSAALGIGNLLERHGMDTARPAGASLAGPAGPAGPTGAGGRIGHGGVLSKTAAMCFCLRRHA